MFTLARKFFFAPVLMAAAALASSTAMAQTKTVEVPFSFVVGHKICPPGLYTISDSGSGNLVSLQGKSGRNHFSWIIGPGDPSPTDSRILLTFDMVGDTYALRTVQYRSGITSRLDNIERMEISSTRILSASTTAGGL